MNYFAIDSKIAFNLFKAEYFLTREGLFFLLIINNKIIFSRMIF